MKFENTEVFNFGGAVRGMRNPIESWDKSDSEFESCFDLIERKQLDFYIGKNDLELMQKLILAGSEHRKFMRQIFVSVDITAPLYWWKEFDTYKVGTVSNSCSTMHKLASTEITENCFEKSDFYNIIENNENLLTRWIDLVEYLEYLRRIFNKTKDKRYWKELIRLLPESWLQKRTVTLNYENIFSMVNQRQNHKLSEWNDDFIWWAKSLPYANELLFLEKEKNGKR